MVFFFFFTFDHRKSSRVPHKLLYLSYSNLVVINKYYIMMGDVSLMNMHVCLLLKNFFYCLAAALIESPSGFCMEYI